ncbi:MAG TPA: rhodanese-like domain-containing protein [Candidatus Limnocylindria bacterium]|nr:rhodanese-like domain-containing protein [Candidatus Limnocylindria bacterium]
MPTTSKPQHRLLALTAALALAGTLAACGGSSTETLPAPSSQSVSTSVTLVNPSAAQALITDGSPVLDVRRPDEFAAGHVEGAVNVNLESPDFAQQLAALDPAAPWVVYCRSGNRSAVATAQMESLGFSRLYDVAGGITAWEQDGLPVTTS